MKILFFIFLKYITTAMHGQNISKNIMYFLLDH
jgi:hypothetical protein